MEQCFAACIRALPQKKRLEYLQRRATIETLQKELNPPKVNASVHACINVNARMFRSEDGALYVKISMENIEPKTNNKK